MNIDNQMPVEPMDTDEGLDDFEIIQNPIPEPSTEVEVFRGNLQNSLKKVIIKKVELQELELFRKRYDRVYQTGIDSQEITNVLNVEHIEQKIENDKLIYYITYKHFLYALNEFMDDKNLANSSLIKHILCTATKGLMHFHDTNYVHRNIRPENIVICQNDSDYVGLIADISMSKPLTDDKKQTVSCKFPDDQYSAPELIIYDRMDKDAEKKATIERQKRKVTSKVDVYSMGMVYYYAVNEKGYPFNNRNNRKVPNVDVLKYSAFFKDALYEVPLAMQLIQSMLQQNPDKRPNDKNVLNHPFFWDNKKRIEFLSFASEYINSKDFQGNDVFNDRNTFKTDYSEWKKILPLEVLKAMKKGGNFPDNVIGLLRALRNRAAHIKSKEDEDLRKYLKENHSGGLEIFLKLYPSLFSDIFNYFIRFSSYDTFREFYCDCFLNQKNKEHQCHQTKNFFIYDWVNFKYDKFDLPIKN